MKVQRIQIEQQMAQIRIESQRASLTIDMPKRTMTVENSRPQLSAEREDPEVKLDMEQFKENLGLKSVRALSEESAARAQAHVAQSIREFSADADYIGTLPSSGNPVARIARNRMLKDKTPEMCSGKVPDGPIKMEGEPGKLDINWSRHDLKINWDEFEPPVITVEPKASVNIQIVQEAAVEYTVVEMEIPPESGRMIDAEA